MKKITIFFLLLLFAFGTVCFLIRPYYIFVNDTLSVSVFKLFFTKNSFKNYNNQVNILFLGTASKDHDGPNLSDTIIVVNYDIKANKLATISVPRDIWSETLRDKINSAYAYGEAKKPDGGGFILAKSEISSIVGFPIQYAAVTDYNKFKDLINFLGGVEIEVERSFTDEKFPLNGKENDDCNGDKQYSCRYETVSFEKGKQTMDGETALKFVRSRNAVGPEGTDFAREKRQQKMIEGIIKKTISYLKNSDLKKLEKLYFFLDKAVKRDISNQHLADIAKDFVFGKNYSINKISLEESLFVNPDISSDYDYRWVLVPKNGNSQIHKIIKCHLEGKDKCL